MADGRFAPSPTGPLHVGNLRTALLSWLFARSSGGRHLVRVEDLDPVASRDEWVEAHLRDLAAIGVDWDGEVVRQSSADRRAAHDDAVAALDAAGLLYPCFCTRREIAEASRAQHGPLPEGAYPGTCRELTSAARAERLATDPAAWRVDAGGVSVTVDDRVCGSVTSVIDDFVVRRKDGVPAYNLAVVVDDAWQHVDEVVRGDDLLDGTPRQAWLADVLGLGSFTYAHVPLVLGDDGERLAKRHGAVTLDDLAADGIGPAAVRLRLLEGLGSAAPGEQVTPAEAVARFDVAAVPRAPWTWVAPGA